MNQMIFEMHDECALDYNDPILTTQQTDWNGKVYEGLAAQASGPVKGTGMTKLELIGYFCRQTTIPDYV